MLLLPTSKDHNNVDIQYPGGVILCDQKARNRISQKAWGYVAPLRVRVYACPRVLRCNTREPQEVTKGVYYHTYVVGMLRTSQDS